MRSRSVRFRGGSPSSTITTTWTLLVAAIGSKTKLVYIATPNNPTGTLTTRAQLDAYFARVPEHVLTVARPGVLRVHRPARLSRRRRGVPGEGGHRVLVLRTFSKIYGLAGLRVGYGVGPADVIQAIGKIRRAFDVSTPGPGRRAREHRCRRRSSLERRPAHRGGARARSSGTLREHGLEPAGPAVANFLFVEVGDEAPGRFFDALPAPGRDRAAALLAFGAPGALRITVGTPEENAFFAEALASVRAATT